MRMANFTLISLEHKDRRVEMQGKGGDSPVSVSSVWELHNATGGEAGRAMMLHCAHRFAFYNCDKHHDQKPSGYSTGSQGRKLEVGTDTEGCCLVACSPWLVKLSFLQNPESSN